VALYVVRRGIQALAVLVGISLATFIMVHLVPGDAARVILGYRVTPAALAQMRHQLGLDKPLLAQYWDYVVNAFRLNFGESTSQQASVASLIAPRLQATLFLAAYATIVSVIIAVPLALISAKRRNRLGDHVIRLVTMTTFAMPPFWLGLLLILGFAVKLAVFPTSGYGSGFGGHLHSLTLPAITLGLGVAPLILRTLRGSIIDILDSEFVEAARARGLSNARVLGRYVLRNSLVATITVLGVNVAYLLGIVVVIENVFVLPGLGSLLVTAVQNRDLPVVQGVALVLGAIVVVVNLATDLSYAVIDPRIRLDGRS